MTDALIYVQAIIVPKPEHVQDVEQGMLELVRASRTEEGCLTYDLLRDEVDGQVRFHVQERYRDMDAVRAHQGSEHYKAYRARAGGWFASAPQVTVLQGVDVAEG